MIDRTQPPAAEANSEPKARGDSSSVRLPELLAPAGDWECVRAAVENGADAVYFGLEKFNARMRADNFTEADLTRLMEYLHRRGVRGYVTFNILVFENELEEAEQFARAIIVAGVDAAIVQDVGLGRMIRRLSPDFPIHASTQMTVTSAAGIEFARELGCDLVVLARECTLKEIGQIQAAQETHPLPLEVFVHGALCVAYSGQCLTSEALGGRSANRGECAQACRMPYELLCDGQPVPLGDRKYLLSPQDLASVELVPELARLGIASLKIEGRLKSPEYVANITRVYRAALDRLAHGDRAVPQIGVGTARPHEHPSALPSLVVPNRSVQYDMEMAFSRGLHTGWFQGINNQELVHGRFGTKRGVFLGEVSEVRRDSVVVPLVGPLKPGDGVVFDAGKPENREEGGRVYEIRPVRSNETRRPNTEGDSQASLILFGSGDIDFARVHAGDKLWKTSDPELERKLRQTFQVDKPRFQRPLEFEVHGSCGKPLTLIVRDEAGHAVRLESQMALEQAEKQPLSADRLTEQLGRLGGSPFRLGCLRNLLQGDVLLPVSELNRLRREAVAELERLRAQPKRWTLNEPVSSPPRVSASGSGLAGTPDPAAKPAELIVLVRNLPQLETTLRAGIHTVYCEFEDLKKYREAVELVRALPLAPGVLRPEIFVAPPRIFKMGEEWTLKQVRSSGADGYLLRNYDHLTYFVNERRIGDYSLNIANRLSAEYFKERFGLEWLTVSYDLNFTQLEALLQSAPPGWFEVTLHQHMPMFHMEHCVFCAFLTQGTDYTNCGRPCDRHQLKLKDRVGAEHPVKADAGCRNTVFNALAQTGAEYASSMLALGVRRFRLEFVDEAPGQVARTIDRYRRLLQGEITGAQLWRELKLFNQLGVTRGSVGPQLKRP